MSREQVEWSMERKLADGENIRAQQSCTYSSILNVNKSNHPYSSSYEHEQTWILTRTLSTKSQRYQSTMENTCSTKPMSSSNKNSTSINDIRILTNDYSTARIHHNHEPIQLSRDRSISLLPSGKRFSSLTTTESNLHEINTQKSNARAIKSMTEHGNHAATLSNTRISPSINKSMRLIQENGEFIVRI
jgi:hypothetical protein